MVYFLYRCCDNYRLLLKANSVTKSKYGLLGEQTVFRLTENAIEIKDGLTAELDSHEISFLK